MSQSKQSSGHRKIEGSSVTILALYALPLYALPLCERRDLEPACCDARGGEGVAQKHGDRHRPDSSGDGSYGGRDFADSFKVDVADEFAGIESIDTDINNHGIGAKHVGFDELGNADRGDEDIG